MTARAFLFAVLVALLLPAGTHAETVWTGAGDGIDCRTTPSSCPQGVAAVGPTVSSGRGLARDAAGNIYFADSTDFRLKRITPGGTIEFVAGDGTECPISGANACGDTLNATSAQLGSAPGISIGPAGDIFIADYGARKIRMVRASDGKLITIAGNGGAMCWAEGAAPTCTESVPATSVALERVQGVVAAPDGTVYFTETDRHLIRKLVPTGGSNYLLSTFAGGPKCNVETDPCGDTLSISTTADRFAYPLGLTLDAGASALYVADWGSNRVRRIDLGTGILTTVAGTGSPCLVLSDTCGDGGPATVGRLWRPTSLSLAPDSALYVSEAASNRIRRIDGGAISTVIGLGAACTPPSPCGDGGAPSGVLVNTPFGVLFDQATGRLWWTEQGNARVRFLAPRPGVTTEAAQGVADTTGTMVATLKTDGLPVTYHFEYGPTTSYGFQTTTQTAATTREPQSVTAALSGLAPGTTIHYRIVAADAAGATGTGGDVTLTTLVVGGGGGGGTTTPTQAALTRATLAVKWRRGVPSGTLNLVGTVDGAASLTVTLRRVLTAGTRPVRGWTVVRAGAGAFAPKLSLPNTLLPGKYRVDVTGSSVGGTVPRVSRNLTLKGPPEGIVADAFAAAMMNGAAATRLPGNRKIVWAIFRFAALPTRGPIHVDWILPNGRRLAGASKPRRTRIEATITSASGLPTGRYRAVLLVGKTELRRVSVRIG